MAEDFKNLDSTFGRLVVEKGLATREEVDRILDRMDTGSGTDSSQKSLSELLVEEGLVTSTQVARLRPELEEQRAERQIPGYQIMHKLGAGAMATVYKARQLSLDRDVAIKVLPQKYSQDANFIQRFYDEGRSAAKLNHPNIVQAYDVGQATQYHYFVMEFVDGRTVHDDIVKQGAYSEREALRIGISVAQALQHAHAAGFIHRDVKPKNIMISHDETVKLADMGLARAVSDRAAAEAEAGKAYGTPYYISPEQIRGEVDVDFRADIYSLGATLFHMLTGRVPFEGPNPSAVMHKHLKGELTPPDHLNASLSQGVSEVIEVAMAKDRKRRYATTDDLLTDLQAVMAGDAPVVARKQFDLASLAELESGEDKLPDPEEQEDTLSAQPLFWVAAAGWVLALILLITVVVVLLTSG